MKTNSFQQITASTFPSLHLPPEADHSPKLCHSERNLPKHFSIFLQLLKSIAVTKFL